MLSGLKLEAFSALEEFADENAVDLNQAVRLIVIKFVNDRRKAKKEPRAQGPVAQMRGRPYLCPLFLNASSPPSSKRQTSARISGSSRPPAV